jgi:hypothetical protein
MSSDADSVVTTYFSRVRARDIGIVELFHDDAVLFGLGSRRSGRAEILDFYRDIIERAGPEPQLVGPLLSDGRRVAAEIRIGLSGGGSVHVVDLFVVEEGRIRSLTYFLASHPPEDEPAPL